MIQEESRRLRYYSFHTEAEALAFIQGVEAVNDSCFTAGAPMPFPGLEDGEENAWRVTCTDTDVNS